MNRRDFAVTLTTGSLVIAGCISTGSNDRSKNSNDQTDVDMLERQFTAREPKPSDVPQNGHQLRPPTIEFESAQQQVIVTGYMEVGNSCKTVVLQQAVYKPKTATMVVAIVDAMRDNVGDGSTGVVSCADAMFAKVYEAVFTFQNALPETVKVHVNNVYDQELTTTARN